jgi:hypothetical protein
MCAASSRRYHVPLKGAIFVLVAIVGGNADILAQASRTGETQLFGVVGRGTSFLYVFDRSLSMKGAALAAAKRELLASVGRLEEVHQFQIVFYNETARMMQPPQMVFGGQNGLRQAESFVTGVTASGGTDHVQALKLALRMNPDVVFFLTDADEPQVSPNELKEIQRRGTGAVIHVIEFKSGPTKGQENWLRKLAEQNRGEYKNVDVTALPR